MPVGTTRKPRRLNRLPITFLPPAFLHRRKIEQMCNSHYCTFVLFYFQYLPAQKRKRARVYLVIAALVIAALRCGDHHRAWSLPRWSSPRFDVETIAAPGHCRAGHCRASMRRPSPRKWKARRAIRHGGQGSTRLSMCHALGYKADYLTSLSACFSVYRLALHHG